jgi:hypothetical protein
MRRLALGGEANRSLLDAVVVAGPPAGSTPASNGVSFGGIPPDNLPVASDGIKSLGIHQWIILFFLNAIGPFSSVIPTAVHCLAS